MLESEILVLSENGILYWDIDPLKLGYWDIGPLKLGY